MNWLNYLSIAVCVLLLGGYLNRRRKSLHITLMVTAMATDVAMVLYLEITRAVIESLPGRGVTPLLGTHIAMSVAVLVLYGVQVATGIKKARGKPSTRHGKVALWLLVLRLGNLVTSFFVI